MACSPTWSWNTDQGVWCSWNTHYEMSTGTAQRQSPPGRRLHLHPINVPNSASAQQKFQDSNSLENKHDFKVLELASWGWVTMTAQNNRLRASLPDNYLRIMKCPVCFPLTTAGQKSEACSENR